MQTKVVRCQLSVVSRAPAKAITYVAATDDGRRTTIRAGISLLEVLISMFILAVGLLSIASLLPVGGSQVQKAMIEDRKSTVGLNAFHEFRTRGMANPENWTGVPQVPGQTFPRPTSVAIDPLVFTLNQGPASRQFPRVGASADSAPRMPRISLKFTTSTTAEVAHLVAQQIFMARDDTVYDKNPLDPDGPAISKWEFDGNNAVARRQFEGNFSWLATLTPAYFDPVPLGPWVWPTEYHLSIVIFYKRSLNNVTTEEGLAVERPLPVSQSPTDLAGFGLGGGELLLGGNELESHVRPGNWVLVSGRYGDPNLGLNVFRWYRVATVGAFEPDNGLRPVTLAGPDWVTDPTGVFCKPTHVTVFEGCVGVFEKMIHLEGPSTWSN